LFDGDFQAKSAYYSIIEGREWDEPVYEIGDANKSGVIDLADFAAMKKFVLGENVKIDAALSDIDSNGIVNSADMSMLKNMILN
jgi:hypothetical protein